MDGIIIIDKPPDITSAKLVSFVKSFFKAKKVGHAGTLDPFATGVMICLINRATRLADVFLHGNKLYSATLCLGIETDTQDFTGTVTRSRDIRPEDYSADDILSAFRAFEGESRQAPPPFSAVKHQGKPLYAYARKGIKVEKPARPVNILFIEVERIDFPLIRFRVRCSGGTYIRALAEDIGRRLGCGAHLKALRRDEAGGFALREAVDLQELERLAMAGKVSDRLVSMNDALRDMPVFIADDVLAEYVQHGRRLEDVFPADTVNVSAGGYFKIVDRTDRLLAVIQKQESSSRYCCVFPNEPGLS